MPDRATMVDVARRALTHHESKATDQAPEVLRVPVASYLDPTVWQAEMGVFRRLPLAVALSAELPAEGTFKAMDVMGVPVLLVRSDDGAVRAFLNVCRHRGAQLCEVGGGRRQRFRCPYHAWVYDDRGELVTIFRGETFGDVDRSQHRLRQLPADERCGLVWVTLTPDEPLDLDAWLGDYAIELEQLGLDEWHVYEQRSFPGPGWKIAYDGYLESYHLQPLHRRTFATHTLTNLMVVDAFGPHQRIVFPSKSLSELRSQPEEEWDPAAHCGAVYTVFPNVSIAGTWQDHGVVSQILPGPTVEQSTTVQTIITRKPPGERDEEFAAMFSELMERGVRDEDYATGFSVQAGLSSQANTHFTFGRNELAVQHYHRALERLMDAP